MKFAEKLARWIMCFMSLVGAFSCAYGIYYLLNMIIQGAATQNWMLILAGGILAYLFIGILGIGFIVCIMILAVLSD